MEDGALIPTAMEGIFSENTFDFDFVKNEFSYDICWLETANVTSFSEPSLSFPSPSNFLSPYVPSPETSISTFYFNQYQTYLEDGKELLKYHDDSAVNSPLAYDILDNQSAHSLVEASEMFGNSYPTVSVKKRLMSAIETLKESKREMDVLIQIWLPVTRAGKHVLTTNNQPFILNPHCKNLADYREISKAYQFAVDEDSYDSVGLPGCVFLKKFPVCTPDVRFTRKEEHPRINYAQKFNVTGSLSLPVFDRSNGSCLGVVEIVTISQKVNYRPELENICKALEAVDMMISEFLIPPNTKDFKDSFEAALAEIREVMTIVCGTYNLPLAQTWAPCSQQGKLGCQQSSACLSIVDSASYVFDPQVLGFYEACSEQHLLGGEGVPGGAFATNQPCFATDVTAFSKAEYPLAHHAKMFRLRGAVAIRLRSIYSGPADFILEFFLPLDCKDDEEQKQVLSSLSSDIQQLCQSLHVVTDKELSEENLPVVDKTVNNGSSWISHMLEAQEKGKGVIVSHGCKKEEPEEFKVIHCWKNTETEFYQGAAFSEPRQQFQQFSGHDRNAKDNGYFPTAQENQQLDTRKSVQKRRVKTERSVSLQVLRQYFPGSLKDAAKSIGVCPTTLKRICRQHGITRWPSRKIKKVGHSLKKLQLVIDSVQGAEGSIQLSSFYANFPELSSQTEPSTIPFSINNHVTPMQTQSAGTFLSPRSTASRSCSSCTHSSGSSFCCSSRARDPIVSLSKLGPSNALITKNSGEMMLDRSSGDMEMQDHHEDQSHDFVSNHLSLEDLPKGGSLVLREGGTFRVKATYGGEKIRLSLPPHWGLEDLHREVGNRFKVEDIGNTSLKYLDEDSEWVLLTCDADLEECIDIHSSSKSQTIKLSLQQVYHPDLGSSFDINGLS